MNRKKQQMAPTSQKVSVKKEKEIKKETNPK